MVPVKMKKSASESSAVAGFDDAEITDPQRPWTERERKTKGSESTSSGEDEEVDAKADDFISRFKQQLKLQRLDSLLRVTDMLKRDLQSQAGSIVTRSFRGRRRRSVGEVSRNVE
ncbi:hypothetical protein F0562_009675 [Nyssa sinensis]|uniref:Uncharacterized protein n=1 Tax=Nyssa sinensis TaxID=561372 RepID=A0A5J5A0K2_9ASTE|nr:hypothetical protein F0562_009675 [Nyssa sinensis]